MPLPRQLAGVSKLLNLISFIFRSSPPPLLPPLLMIDLPKLIFKISYENQATLSETNWRDRELAISCFLGRE
jgi:hypothetical protein